MRDRLFTFQENALSELQLAINDAHLLWRDNKPQVISFSAPTGAGKTIIMTTLFENILYGTAEVTADPDSIFIWLSDSPELNEQTRLKIESKSDKIHVHDLVTIGSTFNAEYLQKGHIYFLNTQKLGSDKLLIAKSDKRQYTIWETITNTAKQMPKQLYVVIDEAHRGTATTANAESQAQSIMQKFIKGSEADGLYPMPLVIGVTATPEKFNKLVEGTTSTVQKVTVSPDDVRESGLLKDRIILNIPDTTISADMTTFQSAIRNWIDKCAYWKEYSDNDPDHEEYINPILVIQVEDGNEREATHTNLSECIDLIEKELGRSLNTGEVVHTFNDYGAITIGDLVIRQVEASRIEENKEIKVVFFKMNLSTGWDCPRAETMMSFRGAQDGTYIAQLLGRMIRTPLARRILAYASLNDVSLFLPHYDKKTAEGIIKKLRDDEAVYPGEVGTNRNLITLERNPSFADVFMAMDDLVTYKIDTNRKQPYIKLYMQLARALTRDGIDPAAQRTAKNSIIEKMDDEVERIKSEGKFDEIKENLTGLSIDTLTFDYGDTTYVYDEDAQTIQTSEYDISRHFDQAGKILGEGLNVDYWAKHGDEDHIDVKIEVISIANNADAMERLSKYAEKMFLSLYKDNKPALRTLPDARKSDYNRMIQGSAIPIETPWSLPKVIDFTVSEDAESYDKHLFVDKEGIFRADLNEWEAPLIKEELANGAVCWLRNLDRKSWSLEIPYEVNGVSTPMYPDLIVVRADALGYVFDILEPHDSSRKDNYPKAVGLAKFADKHHDQFGRIQLIRKHKGEDRKDHFYRLDMNDIEVRNRVRGITSNPELDRIFEEFEERED